MGILSVDAFKALSVQKDNIVIVDARGGADALERFEKGHVKGAVFADLETDLSQKSTDAAMGGRHPLPSPSHFSAFLSSAGITDSSTVVIYDDKNGANAAARLWWMLKSAGHEETHVISGGLQALAEAGFEIVTGKSEPSIRGNYNFESWILPTVTIDEVAAADGDYIVIDVRENYRYRGESEPIDLIAGHIPGAINIPYTSNLDETGRFLSSEILARKYNQELKDIDTKKVYVHCGSGVTACHTLLALEEAGLTGASLYVGSWSEWSRNEKPVATEN
ncbi:sulfurtransferase [Dyadobacter sp. CY312]|uniref:sulfurtransferase n=1 Tax=Dyadobacter sp. CY312 TaxID=2907303 RepID=UPI001F2EFB23|nr:sulfurtransferase [Dyadobacter sp. CY312]MCE7041499.1 sulfurtransferase [Dyadobacter sp. CY312]